MGRTKGSRNKKTETLEYWDDLLKKRGFSMESGRSDRISYVGSANNVDYINDVVSTRNGRVAPKKMSD